MTDAGQNPTDDDEPMSEPTPGEELAVAVDRATMVALGGSAGLAAWLFLDFLPDRLDQSRGLMFAAALVMGAFAVVLALSGPVRLIRALPGVLAVAPPAALLLLWASFRHAEVGRFLQAGHGLAAFALILFIATPYVAAALQAPGGWRDYARLFDNAWTIVVRYAAGWLFVGLFWVALMLSDQLLQLVGLDLIKRLVDIAPVPWLLSGLILGLALAVIHEMRDYVSPYLIHRLLRLLLPMMLPVVAVFLVALPLRGLSGLFGDFSAAATLMAVALAGITLISTALDRSDEEAATGAAMLWSTRAFALAVPVLAGLGIHAVWLRVAQYGWTPPRLAAALTGVFLLAYGLAYAAAVLRGGAGWMAHIRRVNLGMALALVAAAALWLTPLVNAERIAATSQLARARAALDRPDRMALWELAQGWGRPGQAALASLEAEARAGGANEVLAAIGRARDAGSRAAFLRATAESGLGAPRDELAGLMQIRPDSAALPQGAFGALRGPVIERWLEACRKRLPDGRAGCAIVIGDFRPGVSDPNGYVLLNMAAGYVRVEGVVLRDGRLRPQGQAQSLTRLSGTEPAGSPGLRPGDLAAVLDGNWQVAPVTLNALKIGERELIPDN